MREREKGWRKGTEKEEKKKEEKEEGEIPDIILNSQIQLYLTLITSSILFPLTSANLVPIICIQRSHNSNRNFLSMKCKEEISINKVKRRERIVSIIHKM